MENNEHVIGDFVYYTNGDFSLSSGVIKDIEKTFGYPTWNYRIDIDTEDDGRITTTPLLGLALQLLENQS